MKKGMLCLLLIMAFADAFAQKNKCNCQVFLSPEFVEKKVIYTQPDAAADTYSVVNLPMNEDFVHLTLLAQKGDWLQVAPFGVQSWYDTGWTDNSHIAVYGTNYDAPLNIYKKRDTTSTIIATVRKGYEPIYHVTGCKDDWLEVECTIEDRPVKGWLAPQDQCGSAYLECK